MMNKRLNSKSLKFEPKPALEGVGGLTSLNSAVDPDPVRSEHSSGSHLFDIKICKILLGFSFRMRPDQETPASK
jgi:hypothetical protein